METRARKAPAIHSEYILPELGAFCKRQRLLPSYPYRQSALTNDAGSIETDFLSQQLSVITKLVTFLGALGMMLWYSPLLTAVAAGLMLLPLAASILTGNRLQAAEARVSDRNRDFTAALRDCLDGFPVVKTFRVEKEIFRLFAENSRALEQALLRRYDGILVLKNGEIAESGSFDELMARKGYFYALYSVLYLPAQFYVNYLFSVRLRAGSNGIYGGHQSAGQRREPVLLAL